MSCTKYTKQNMEYIILGGIDDPGELTAVEIGHGFADEERNYRCLARTYQLHIVVGGSGGFLGEAAVPGVCYLVRRGDYYREQGLCEQYWINFSGSTAASLLDSLGIGTETRMLYPSKECYELAAAELESFFASDIGVRGDRLYLLGTLYRVLSLLGSNAERSADNSAVGQIRVYIDRCFAEPMTLSSLAERVNLSPKYLSRIFTEQVGQTISAYLTHTRLVNACALLLHTDRPISEIAASVGYPDPLYFSRAFKRLYNVSPQAWRSGAV